MKKIFTLTMNPAVDKYLPIKLLEPERKIRSSRPNVEPGGGGINVARAVRELRGEATAVYVSGGITGRQLDELLAREHLDTVSIPTSSDSRENINVIEESTGQIYRVVTPGPTLTENEWRRCYDFIAHADPFPEYVIASGSLPPGVPTDFYGRLAQLVRDRGGRFIVDTTAEPLQYAVDVGVFLLKPTLYELSRMAGFIIKDRRDQEEVGRKIVDKGRCEVLVLSLGAAGVLTVTREETFRLKAPTVRPVNRIGAGDSLVAGAVVKLLEGWNLREAIRYGVAAGTAAVLTPGSLPCRHDDVEQLYHLVREE